MSKSKYITFFKLCLFSIMLISNAFARQEIIDYETFVHLDKKSQYETINMLQVYHVSAEHASRQGVKVQFNKTSYFTPMWNLIPEANAVSSIDENTNFRCMFAGWPSIISNQINKDGKHYCTHPSRIEAQIKTWEKTKEYRNNNLIAQTFDQQKVELRSTAKTYKDSANNSANKKCSDPNNKAFTVCNPSIFGKDLDRNPVCISGSGSSVNNQKSYNNISYACLQEFNKLNEENDNVIIDNMIAEANGNSAAKDELQKNLLGMYNICMCKDGSREPGIHQEYVDRIFGHRTCYGILMQTQGILERLDGQNYCLFKNDKPFDHSDVANMADFANQMYQNLTKLKESFDPDQLFSSNDKLTDDTFNYIRQQQIEEHKKTNTCPLRIDSQLELTKNDDDDPNYIVIKARITGILRVNSINANYTWEAKDGVESDISGEKNIRKIKLQDKPFTLTVSSSGLSDDIEIPAREEKPSISITATKSKENPNKYTLVAKLANSTATELITWNLDGLEGNSPTKDVTIVELTAAKPKASVQATLNIAEGEKPQSEVIPLEYNSTASVSIDYNLHNGSYLLEANISGYDNEINSLTSENIIWKATDSSEKTIAVTDIEGSVLKASFDKSSVTDYPITINLSVKVKPGFTENEDGKIHADPKTIEGKANLEVTNSKIENEDAYYIKVELKETSKELNNDSVALSFFNSEDASIVLAPQPVPDKTGVFKIITKDKSGIIKVKAVYSLESDEKLEGETTIEIAAQVPAVYTLVLDASEPVDHVVTITAKITKDGEELEEDSDEYKTLIKTIKWFGTDGEPTGETEAEDEIKETTENSDEETTGSGSGSGSGADATSEGKKSGQTSIEIEQKVNLKYEIKAKIPEAKKSDPISVDALDPPIPDPTLDGIKIKITKTTDGERTSVYTAKLVNNDGEKVDKPEGAKIAWTKKIHTSSSESSDDEDSNDDEESSDEEESSDDGSEGDDDPLDTDSDTDDDASDEAAEVTSAGSGESATISKDQNIYIVHAILKLESDEKKSNPLVHAPIEEKTPARRGGGMNPMLKQTPPAPQLIQKGKNTIHQGWD